LAVLVAQRATVPSSTSGFWEGGQVTDSTRAELLWCRLPPTAIVLIAVIFFVGLRWCVPEKGTRGMIRAWGFFFRVLSTLVSFGMSCFFGILHFYTD
jgi:hypothetical protein